MHVIIAFLGAVISLLWILHRLAEMGIDLGGLNPFLWRRRTKWKKHHDADPIFKIDSPLEATALLITAVAKADGDMSAEEKREVLSVFQNEFHLSARDATALLTSSSHLLGRGDEVKNNIKAVLKPSLANYTPEQATSAIELLQRIARVNGMPSEGQNQLIDNASAILQSVTLPKGKWA